MNKISKETESRMMQAIEKSALLINDGDHPNDAIVKAAQEFGVPPGNINLMVHAYNTGRTDRQRKSSQDTWEKAADFETADAAVILEKLYPTKVKTASEHRRDTAVSTQYALPPTGLLERQAAREKRAVAIDWKLVDKPAAYPGDPNTAMKRASAQVDRDRHYVEDIRRQMSAAMDKAAGTFGELEDYFRSPGCQPIPIVRENVLLLHGNHGELVMDQLVSMSPGLAKMASHQVGLPRLLPPALGLPYVLVGRLMSELGAFAELKDTFTKSAAAAQQQAEVLLGPFVQGGASPSVLDGPPWTKQAAGAPSTTGAALKGGLIGYAMNGIASGLKPPENKQLLQGHLNSLTDPNHEAELRKVRSQAMLQNMLLNDDVISGYDPDDALMAYNEIVEMAPHLQDQSLAVQSLMRKRLTQGALDPSEVDQLLGMEGKKRTNSQPYSLPAGVGADGSVLV